MPPTTTTHTRQGWTVASLGTAQTLAWASTYYLPAMIAVPMGRDLGVATPTVFAAFSAALIVSAFLGPYAGRAIDSWGGRPVLAAASLVFAAGLASLGLATGPAGMFAAWLIIGVGMGSGLYEAAFAALVRLHGSSARPAITGITLIAGFASTVGWPLTSLLEAQYGWRTACFAWAGLHLVLGLPLNLALPKAAPLAPGLPESAVAGEAVAASAAAVTTTAAATAPKTTPATPRPATKPATTLTTALLAYVFAATWFISTAMAAHLPRVLELAGATLAVAVAAGALVGPAQVAARLLEFGLLRRVHPLYSAILAALAHPLAAAALLFLGAPAAPVRAAARRRQRHPHHRQGHPAPGAVRAARLWPSQGLLTVPARMAQAAAPFAFGLCLDRWGAGALWLSAAIGLSAFVALLLIPRPVPA